MRLVSLLLPAGLLVGCDIPDSRSLKPYEFRTTSTQPQLAISNEEVHARAALGVRPGDRLISSAVYPAYGLGQAVVQAVVQNDDGARAYVVDESGAIEPTEVFWRNERLRREKVFGKLTPELFEQQLAMAEDDNIEVEITIKADLPQPRLPFDGTDVEIPIEQYEQWFNAHAQSHVPRLAQAKHRLLATLLANGATVRENPRGLPLIRASVPVALLRSQELNADDVSLIETVPAAASARLLGDHAGHAAMKADVLIGGLCGTARCDGGTIDVGLWERDPAETGYASGLARNNSRVLGTSGTVTGYYETPRVCSVDGDCVPPSGDATVRRVCRSIITTLCSGSSCASGASCQSDVCVTNQKMCVQDHLSSVTASIGMGGSYSYGTTVPGGLPDPTPNVPAGTVILQNGAYRIDIRVGNAPFGDVPGLDFLISPPPGTGGATPYINRSMTTVGSAIDWPGRAYGTFITAAGGNTAGNISACSNFKNGLCVGWYEYETYNDLASHRRTFNSPFANSTSDSSLERPHLLGPGIHTSTSGLHMPNIDVTPPSDQMRFRDVASEIAGSSFASPAVLSAAIQAHQYEGWFSALAFPMVNKAVLLASTQDGNNDGAIGKSTRWYPQPVDAEDGAGQLNFALIKQVLDSNQYTWNDLVDSDFTSCGTGCRMYTAATIAVPANTVARVALTWQACMTSQQGAPIINNDLDLVLSCGNPIFVCGGSYSSTSVSSELEMIQRPACPSSKTCTIQVRIKNGAALAACSASDTAERIGVAWSYRVP